MAHHVVNQGSVGWTEILKKKDPTSLQQNLGFTTTAGPGIPIPDKYILNLCMVLLSSLQK